MEEKVLDFFFELGMLKRVKHEGWRLLGIKDPESVGEHSLRAAQIGFILAKLEKYENPYEVATMVVFHDIGECRVGDIHKVANRYIKVEEERAVREQTEGLGEVGKEIFSLWEQHEKRTTKAGIIARDADLLEMAITAKEHVEIGYKFAEDWIRNVSNAVQTESAKKLLSSLERTHANQWWQGLKKLEKN
ncbi:MAG TPA: HD domain-containing protein [Candidatus Nanoarchaeia archaeon]|nr:HD domain-containing protein [Candidatus Nanoarchaeia archaeon]